MNVIWHDLECGGYAADLPLWRSLAATHGDPVLDIGAGTGRVALDLARHGHRVTALERDPELFAALSERAAELEVQPVLADAREFELPERFALCIVPMQTIQLLGGQDGRRQFLVQVRRHLLPGAAAAFAISARLDLYECHEGTPGPLPDITEIDGVVYSSQPTAVRENDGAFLLVRRRERVNGNGIRTTEEDRIELDRISPEQLEADAMAVGLQPAGRTEVAATEEYVASQVVIVHA